MRRIYFLLAAVGIAVAMLGGVAKAHSFGYDSVDSREYIVFYDQTSLDGALLNAKQDWNKVFQAYNQRGFAIVNQNTTNTPSTVDVYDYSNCGSSTAGYYDPNGAPSARDLISVNRCASAPGRTMTHEFGHAGRFAHPKKTEYYRLNAIMYPCSACARTGNPMYHDYKDYQNIWVR